MATEPSLNVQAQSRLVSLPPELKNIIFGYCFVADTCIVDPGPSTPQADGSQQLGLGLLRTCRRLHYEVDRRPLYTRNKFRFTDVDRLNLFLDGLPQESRKCIRNIEIDAHRVHAVHPGIESAWLGYLARGEGTWPKTLHSLRSKVPNLECIRFNVASWSNYHMFGAELWRLLRAFLAQIGPLRKITLVGAFYRSYSKEFEPWSPIYFVGRDNVEPNDLIQCMGHKVAGPDADKLIRWIREDGKLELEVESKNYPPGEEDRPCAEVTQQMTMTNLWPRYGFCTWPVYEELSTGAANASSNALNPSGAE